MLGLESLTPVEIRPHEEPEDERLFRDPLDTHAIEVYDLKITDEAIAGMSKAYLELVGLLRYIFSLNLVHVHKNHDSKEGVSNGEGGPRASSPKKPRKKGHRKGTALKRGDPKGK